MLTKKDQLKYNKKPKRKRCKECNKLFTPEREMQPCCTFDCEIAYISNKNNLKKLIDDGKKNRIKESNKKKKELKENDKSYWIQKAQKEFNKFIRLRDKNEKCISCDYIWNNGGYQRQAHASHYISVNKSKALRFNELNVWKSCQQCNTHLSGNLAEYRIRLIKKIGLEKVEELERIANHSQPDKYTIENYKEIYNKYKEKIKEL